MIAMALATIFVALGLGLIAFGIWSRTYFLAFVGVLMILLGLLIVTPEDAGMKNRGDSVNTQVIK